MAPAIVVLYRRCVRTNNDCESWHARLNQKAENANLPFYKLIILLHRESKMINLTLKMLCEKKMNRVAKKTTNHIQTKLFNIWDEFDAGTLDTNSLLKKCSHIYVFV